jgi:hypothetical protein
LFALQVCTRLAESQRKQTSEFLPVGWTYCFSSQQLEPTGNALEALDGLLIIAPGGDRFVCVEIPLGMPRFEKDFENVAHAPEKLYSYLGLSVTWNNSSALCHKAVPMDNSPPRKRQCLSEENDTPFSEHNGFFREISPVVSQCPSSVVDSESLNPRGLYQRSCGSCVMCLRQECKRCVSCFENEGGSSRSPQVCFRKMCVEIPIATKKVIARGFAVGWSFCFLPSHGATPSDDEQLGGLVIISPMGQHFYNVDEAFIACGATISSVADEMSKREFFEQIGASTFRRLAHHSLLGELYMQEWIRADCTKMVITGKITEAEKDIISKEERFTVSYNAESLKMANCGSPSGLRVSPSAHVDSHVAWDGCLRGHEMITEMKPTRLLARKPSKLERWLTPFAASREMVPTEEAQVVGYRELPVLRLRYKSFLLKFRVRKSTIEGAGFGVFLSVVSELDKGPKEFILESGELLDFGVYAPFREEDVRSDHEFLVKSLIHDCKNEAYAWESNTREKYLDITDNVTGELHMIARTHVHPFVNEIQDPTFEIPVVLPRMDPEGACHYLLGHAPQYSAEPFVFAADGSETEIFVDYGEHYENVVSILLRKQLGLIHAYRLTMYIFSDSDCEKAILAQSSAPTTEDGSFSKRRETTSGR